MAFKIVGINLGFAHIQGNHATTTTGTTSSLTLSSSPTKGNLVACSISYYSGGASGTTISSVKDGNNNSYTVTPDSPNTYDTSGGQEFMFYLLNAPANANNTITVTFANSGFSNLWCDEFQVLGGTAAYDLDSGASGSTGTAVNTPSLTPSASGDLVYGACDDQHTITGENGPWTSSGSPPASLAAYVPFVNSALAISFIQSTSGGHWSCMEMAFKFTVPKVSGFQILQ